MTFNLFALTILIILFIALTIAHLMHKVDEVISNLK